MGRIAPKRASCGSNEEAVGTGMGSLHGGKDQFGTCCTFERDTVEVPLVGQGRQSSDGGLEFEAGTHDYSLVGRLLVEHWCVGVGQNNQAESALYAASSVTDTERDRKIISGVGP